MCTRRAMARAAGWKGAAEKELAAVGDARHRLPPPAATRPTRTCGVRPPDRGRRESDRQAPHHSRRAGGVPRPLSPPPSTAPPAAAAPGRSVAPPAPARAPGRPEARARRRIRPAPRSPQAADRSPPSPPRHHGQAQVQQEAGDKEIAPQARDVLQLPLLQLRLLRDRHPGRRPRPRRRRVRRVRGRLWDEDRRARGTGGRVRGLDRRVRGRQRRGWG